MTQDILPVITPEITVSDIVTEQPKIKEQKKEEPKPIKNLRDPMYTSDFMEDLYVKMNALEKNASISMRKQAQVDFLINEMKNLFQHELEYLCRYMRDVQSNDQKNKHFAIIRHERYSLFGKGNTDSWQKVYHAAKMALIDIFIKLSKEKDPHWKKRNKLILDKSTYDYAIQLLGEHTGRWYARCGQPASRHVFEHVFCLAEEAQEIEQSKLSSQSRKP